MGLAIVYVEYFGKWVNEETCWKWYESSRNVIALGVSTEITFNELIDEIIRRGELDCSRKDIIVKYDISKRHLHYKVPLVKLQSDECVKLYMLEVGDYASSRPVLRVSVMDKPLATASKIGENDDVGFNFNNEGIDFFVEKSGVGTNFGGKEDIVHIPANVEVSMNTDSVESAVGEVEDTIEVHVDSKAATKTTISNQASHLLIDGSDLYVEYLFNGKEEVVRKLKLVAMRANFEHIIRKSNSSVVTVECRDRNCKWRVYCKRYTESRKFIVSKYTSEHTCGLGHISGHHQQASANVVRQFVQSQFVDGKCMSPKEIQNYVRTKLGYDVSYWKCWKGKQHAQSFVKGTLEHAYKVPRKEKCSICKKPGHTKCSCRSRVDQEKQQ